MKNRILIVYATKAGTTEDCANIISKELKGEVDVVNLKKTSKFNLNDYECIIIGTPIYAGMINKKVKQFCLTYENILNDKIIGLFTCGISTKEEALASLSNGISTKLKESAKVIKHFNGELRPEKLGFFMRFIAKQMTKVQTAPQKINKDVINEFCEEINKLVRKGSN